MKRVKKFTTSIDILIFICATILFSYQVYGVIDSNNLGQSVCSEFYKVIFAIFFLVISAYKITTHKVLLLGFLTIVSISLCYDFRNEYVFEVVFQYALIYLLALPFAELLDDAKRQVYLKWYAVLYSFISIANLIGCYLLLFEGGANILPERFSYHKARLSIGPHPNTTAMLFSINIGLLVFLFFQVKKIGTKILLVFLICAYFPLLWVTNSRTNALLMIFFVLAIMFLSYLSRATAINVKKVAAILLSLCACAILLLILYNIIFSHNRDAVLEQTGANVDLQMSLWDSFASFNGRTDIWKLAFELIFSDKKILLFGTNMQITVGDKVFPHAHNAWVQFFMSFGVFGLIFSIYYTFRAIKATIVILFLKRDQTTMAQKTIALFVCILMVANTMEPYIFVSYFMTINFTFFLLLGYMLVWERELKN